MKRLLTAVVISGVLATSAFTSVRAANESYLCKAEMAVGFDWNPEKGKWVPTTFDHQNMQWMVTPDERPTEAYMIHPVAGV